MLVYISGKIGPGGITPEVKEKFAKAEQILRQQGYKVINPVSDEYQESLIHASIKAYTKDSRFYGLVVGDPYTLALAHGIMSIIVADAIAFLPDYRSSRGAMAEYYFAKAIEKIRINIKLTNN